MLHVGELLGSNIEDSELSAELLLVLLCASAVCCDVLRSFELESGDFDNLILIGNESSDELECLVEFELFSEVSEFNKYFTMLFGEF